MPETTATKNGGRSVAMIIAVVVITLALGGLAWTDLPSRFGWSGSPATAVSDRSATGAPDPPPGDVHSHDADDHSGHSHGDHSHDVGGEAIEISRQARGNLGLTTQEVSTSTYTHYVTMPATIIDWPGKTHIEVTAPLTGVVSGIFVSRGELIRSGQPLFSLRLTHQDLVRTQADFLTALGRLDVEQREINRLTDITKSGAVAGKALIEHQYALDRLQAELRAERQAMLLHGLTEDQVARIEKERTLVREVTIYAPTLHDDASLHHESEYPRTPAVSPASAVAPDRALQPESNRAPPDSSDHAHQHRDQHEHIEAEFLVTSLDVNRGQSVMAGNSLGRLSDYSVVLIEGHAFQGDAPALRAASKFHLPLQAVIDSSAQRPEILEGLQIAFIGNEIGIESRALPFFVPLQNQTERNETREGQRYVSWRFKPGQRLQLRVPLEGFDDTIVVPKEAVAEEGAERYVFVDQGDHFDRRRVRVLARDELWVAIANDGSVRSGQSIAITGAHQLQMEMKNKAGGPIDPHAGHNH